MPRRARSYDKHAPLPDPKFGNTKYAKFINYLMLGGKKSVAQKILYTALDIVEEKKKGLEEIEGKNSQDVFDIALKNVAPIMEIKGRRIGGSNYQVPMEVQEPRRTALGMKWMIAAARARKGVPMAQKLAAEIIDAFQKQGAAIKKREDTHRMAEANKAFAHFARFGNKRK
jgi:small subunit ribosomal protein S7